MTNIYPIGYSAQGAPEQISQLMAQSSTLLIDTRLKPYSWDEQWRQEALQSKYGQRYRWAGKSLGNLNYNKKEEPIALANPEVGINGLMGYLAWHDLILLCQCKELAKCHVSAILKQLQVRMPAVQIIGVKAEERGCIRCGLAATIFTPSGQGACSKHGYCKRVTCLKPISLYVWHERMQRYVCPCIIKYEQKYFPKQED